MIGPRQRGLRPIQEGRAFGADNDAFHGKFTMESFEAHLKRLWPYREQALFVAAPDFVHDPGSTLAVWMAFMRELGDSFMTCFPMAFVAQTGCTPDDIPSDASALFLAGADEWREGPAGRDLIACAKDQGMHVHVGRVNSARRLLHFARLGVDSCDGTYLSFRGFERGVQDIAGWLDAAHRPPRKPLTLGGVLRRPGTRELPGGLHGRHDNAGQ